MFLVYTGQGSGFLAAGEESKKNEARVLILPAKCSAIFIFTARISDVPDEGNIE